MPAEKLARDLWGGSAPAIRKSIQERLLTLPDDTLIIPGHGRETTVLRERKNNPHVGRFSGQFGDANS